jgi:hypothetical protein
MPQKGKFALNIYVKDVFGNVYSFLSYTKFDVSYAIPEVPQLINHYWASDEKKYCLEMTKSEDAYYYDVYRAISASDGSRDSTIKEFVGRTFVNSSLTTVIFEDSDPVKGWSIYYVYAVDGAGTSSSTEFSVNVANRAPNKVKLISPSGNIATIPDPVTGLWAYWTEGEDVDISDTVTYQVYIKDSSEFVMVNATTSKSTSLNYRFSNGTIYYIRVDSFDGTKTTKGDVYSFVIGNSIVQAPIITASLYHYDSTAFQWNPTITFTHENPYGTLNGMLTRYVVQFSQYASFPAASTFEDELWSTGTVTFTVPSNYSPIGSPMFVRIKAVLSSNKVILNSNWSNVWRVK